MVVQDYTLPNRYTPGDLELLATIAGQVGLAVERKQAEIALRESANSLREAQTIASLGSYELDVASGRWQSSEALDHIFGIDARFARTVFGAA